jgi:hypothetical protein
MAPSQTVAITTQGNVLAPLQPSNNNGTNATQPMDYSVRLNIQD